MQQYLRVVQEVYNMTLLQDLAQVVQEQMQGLSKRKVKYKKMNAFIRKWIHKVPKNVRTLHFT